MFSSNKKVKTSTNVTNTVIGEGMTVEAARLSGVGSLRIDGDYSGIIDIDGELVLGETGRIDGDIRARRILLAGKVQGNIDCMTLLHVTHTASLVGNVVASSFMVDEGAVFNGQCQMNNNSSAYKEPPMYGEEQDEDRPYLQKI